MKSLYFICVMCLAIITSVVVFPFWATHMLAVKWQKRIKDCNLLSWEKKLLSFLTGKDES